MGVGGTNGALLLALVSVAGFLAVAPLVDRREDWLPKGGDFFLLMFLSPSPTQGFSTQALKSVSGR